MDEDDGTAFWIWATGRSELPFPASTVPMLGGPLDGESVVITEPGRLPEEVPFPFHGKAYVYGLKSERVNGWLHLKYEYSGAAVEVETEEER
jgi:hypothetical protein